MQYRVARWYSPMDDASKKLYDNSPSTVMSYVYNDNAMTDSCAVIHNEIYF